jgi:hypothetical protein
MIELRLAPTEELKAAEIGYQRQVNAVRQGFTPRHRGGSLWGGTIESTCAELAVAIALELDWTGREVWERPPVESVPDVGGSIEVRWSERGQFLTFDATRDKESRLYVLVSGYAPRFKLLGYMAGDRCRRPEWHHSYPERDVYRVPVEALNPIDPWVGHRA